MAGRVVAIAPAGRRDGTGVSRLARRRCFSPGAVATAPARVPARGGPARAPPPRLAVRAAYPGKGQASPRQCAPARAFEARAVTRPYPGRRGGAGPRVSWATGRCLRQGGDTGVCGVSANTCRRGRPLQARESLESRAPGLVGDRAWPVFAPGWSKHSAVGARSEPPAHAPGVCACAWRFACRGHANG